MYLGRFVVVSPTVAAYRVSSRSFPNRHVYERDGALVVGPTADAPETENPYIAYNCVRTTDDTAVVGNGSHVDPIAEKLARGYPARDALTTALHALDFEKDDYDTPRVAGTISEDGAYIATVRRDALHVQAVTEPTLVATYERATPAGYDLDATAPADAARELYDADFEHAVCAAAVAPTADGFETAHVNE